MRSIFVGANISAESCVAETFGRCSSCWNLLGMMRTAQRNYIENAKIEEELRNKDSVLEALPRSILVLLLFCLKSA
jgi:hypothetical protein